MDENFGTFNETMPLTGNGFPEFLRGGEISRLGNSTDLDLVRYHGLSNYNDESPQKQIKIVSRKRPHTALVVS